MSAKQKSEEIYEGSQINAAHKAEKSIVSLLIPKAISVFLNNNSTLRQGIEKMRFYGYTALPVISEDGTYVGTVSEGDFLWNMLDKELYHVKSQEEFLISSILREGWNPPVRIEATMDELLLRITDQNFVPVIDDRDKYVGIITRKAVIQYYHELYSK